MNAEKEEAIKTIQSLPDTATWDDIMYHFYVKKKLSEAMQEAAAGKTISHEKVKGQFLRN